jgi:capsular exopolysaccharide synthesis family protein
MITHATSAEQGIPFREWLYVLTKRKWWFLCTLLTAISIASLVNILMAPIYLSKCTLQILQDDPSTLVGRHTVNPMDALMGGGEIDRFYETQYKILQSPTMVYGLIDSLNLTVHPSYKQIELENEGASTEVIRRKYAEFFTSNFKVEPIKNSFLVDISFRSTDPNLARRVPEAVQEEYLQLVNSSRRQANSLLREWLEEELTRLGNKLEISERNLYAHGQMKDFLSLETGSENVIIHKYIELSRLLTIAQSEKAAKEAQLRHLTDQGSHTLLIANNPLVLQLRQQVIEIEGRVAADSKIFGPKYPQQEAMKERVKELHRRQDEEIDRLGSGIKADYEVASRLERLLEEELELQRAKVVDLQNDLVQHHILKRDLQANQTLYEGLLARMKEATIASNMVAGNVSMISPAETPHKAIMPKPLVFFCLALVLGSTCGIVLAFFVEYMDTSIKSAEEVELFCHLPALGVVPMAEGANSVQGPDGIGMIAYTHPVSIIAEAFFHIRTAIMLSSSETHPRVMTITSPNPHEGKTVSSLNLAITLTGKNRKCLIIDCDLRKPMVHKVFQEKRGLGLADCLTGSATLSEIIRSTIVPNLQYISAGSTPPNPNELLASEIFGKVVEQLRGEFDHIVLDCPPILGFADARSISSHTDGVVLLFKHHCTTREAGQLAVQLLYQNDCRILGVILSMARKNRMGNGGYYHHYRCHREYYAGE